MEVDPKEVVEQAVHSRETPASEVASAGAAGRRDRLNAAVAVTVAVLATFMGICKVKDDNIVQAMQAAQVEKLDQWSFYQARNIRQLVAESTAEQLQLARLSAAPAAHAAYDAAIAKYKEEAAYQARAKQELKEQAEQSQRTYDALNYRDDQFDLSDALLAISIALLAVAALTQLWPLYFLALVPTFFGMLMGLAGLAGWQLHPDVLIKLLS